MDFKQNESFDFDKDELVKIESFKSRLTALYKRFNIDSDEKINHTDVKFLIKASQVGSKEWYQLKLDILSDIIDEIDQTNDFTEAEEALKSWENYQERK